MKPCKHHLNNHMRLLKIFVASNSLHIIVSVTGGYHIVYAVMDTYLYLYLLIISD